MLRIRKETKEALDKATYENFKKRMVEHVQKHFPDECAKLGPEQVKSQVD